jgi:XTP/dITP diphosphohydrolase
MSSSSPETAGIRVNIGGQTYLVTELNSSNEGKLTEYARLGLRLAPRKVEVAELQLSDSQFQLLKLGTPEAFVQVASEISEAKAKEAARALGRPIFVDDSAFYAGGLLARLTGPNIKLWDTRDGLEALCRFAKLESIENALAVVVLAVANPEGAVRSFAGAAPGSIADAPRGDQGFSWDKIFVPDGDTRTFAEMSRAEKDGFSMRAKAVQKLFAEAEACTA